jgi:hypothetical protein
LKENYNIISKIAKIFPKGKKALLGKISFGFIVILMGITILPMITQEINNASNCNLTSSTGNFSYQEPIGSTDSFGGGGSGHFGGYDGTVKKSWTIVETNKSYIFNAGCKELSLTSQSLLKLISVFFILSILIIGVRITIKNISCAGII